MRSTGALDLVALVAALGCGLAAGTFFMAALLRWADPRAPYWLLGSVLHFVGTVLVTVMCNVPRNQALAVLAPGSAEAVSLWTDYLSGWTFWNHVRTAAGLAAVLSFTMALWGRA